jgi:hypothetical protein
MKQGRSAQELRKQFGMLGTVSVGQVTWSNVNGWHPHCHELVFFSSQIDADEYAQAASELLQRAAEHEGLSMNEHGFKLDRTNGAVADYVAKFGREPLKTSWGPSADVKTDPKGCFPTSALFGGDSVQSYSLGSVIPTNEAALSSCIDTMLRDTSHEAAPELMHKYEF